MEINNQAVADVMALMVHEIKGDLFDLADMVSDNKEVVHRIDDIARRAERIVAYYQIASGSSFFCLSPVFVGDLVREAIVRVGSGNGIKLQFVPSDDHVWLMARDLVGDMLANGLRNAMRYARSVVTVSAHVAENGDLRLVIADDGKGFPDLVLNSGPLAMGGGLFIADRVMALHKSNGQNGFLSLENGGDLAGAMLTLSFPSGLNGDGND